LICQNLSVFRCASNEAIDSALELLDDTQKCENGTTQPMAVKAALKNTKNPSYLFNAREIGHGGHE
jgi:hypothetical protein